MYFIQSIKMNEKIYQDQKHIFIISLEMLLSDFPLKIPVFLLYEPVILFFDYNFLEFDSYQ